MSDESNVVREAHPAALLFPMMPMDELQKLADDIRVNGLLEPIELLDGRIIDGRNRLKACELAGVAPRYEVVNLDGGSPTEYVASKNLHRRHLTASERAGIGADMVPLLQEEAKERQRQGGRNGGQMAQHNRRHGKLPPNSAKTSSAQKTQGECRMIAAKALRVGKTQIQTALAVKEKDPEEFARIKRGEVTVNAAYRKVHNGIPAKPAALPPGALGTRRAGYEKAETARMVKGLSRIQGMCRGLAGLKPSLIVVSPDERKAWVKSCSESAKALHAFAARIREAS